VAVAWTLAWPGVTAAIVGARGTRQVDGWIDAARLALSESDIHLVASAIERSGAGYGPTQPRAPRDRRADKDSDFPSRSAA
jgi:aryl-alcohol dehydrogenase-like predicted oxidoreductase